MFLYFISVEDFTVKDFVTWLLSGERSGAKATLFGFWHIFYFMLIMLVCAVCVIIYRKRSEESKEKLLRGFAFAVIAIYIADFFLMPLSDSYNFEIAYYKLPFHACTLMGVIAPIAQFNTKFGHKIKPTVAILAIVPAFMWMCYPGTAIGYHPFTYVLIQTFMYRGVLFSWGFLTIALGAVKLDIKKCWREFVALLIILVWASIGNVLYDGVQDWFFLENGMFGIPPKFMPFAVVGSIFAMCLIVYGFYYATLAIINRKGKACKKES